MPTSHSPRLSRLAALLVMLMVLTACAAPAAAPSTSTAAPASPLPATAAGPSTVAVTLVSFSVKPDVTSAKAGDVTFNVTNATTDAEQHEFVVVQTDLAADKLPVGSDSTVTEDAVKVVDELEPMDPGKGGTLTVNLAAGHYVLLCNRPGHYQQGMHVDFTVAQ